MPHESDKNNHNLGTQNICHTSKQNNYFFLFRLQSTGTKMTILKQTCDLCGSSYGAFMSSELLTHIKFIFCLTN